MTAERTPTSLYAARIPAELRERDQWVVWKRETGQDGKPKKRPYRADGNSNVKSTDIIDLVQKPTGTDDENSDGCDGSAMWLQVDTKIPANPVQPDGTPFEPSNRITILSIVHDPVQGKVTVTWKSTAGATYNVEASPKLNGWTAIATGLPSAGAQTSYAEPFLTPPAEERFYRVIQK